MILPRKRNSDRVGPHPSSRRKREKPLAWSVEPMEARVMLAGDVGEAVESSCGDESGTAIVASPRQQSEPRLDPLGTTDAALDSPIGEDVAVSTIHQVANEIAFVDSGVEHLDQFLDASRQDVDIVLLDDTRDPIAQMTEVLRGRHGLKAIHIVSHGQSGQLLLGGSLVDVDRLNDSAETMRSWRESLHATADVLIYGCDVAAGQQGQRFIQTMAQLTGADITASVDRTASNRQGGNWVLERRTGEIEAALLASSHRLQNTSVVLPITIRAAGSDGREQMQLQIDGQTVQTWDNIAGDAGAGQFVEYTYNGATGVSADSVRIRFTNDVYEPAQNIDYNLRVDSITIDGQVFQTEDPSVFSTGTWKPADGIVPGFREDEWLHTDGYFQFAETNGGPTGSLIEIYAAGNENDEIMELWIDGSRVQTWNDIGGDAYGRQFERYAFTASGSVQPEDVQIFFTNDRYENNGEIDRNLRVDRILIDGTTFQTEDPSVFSTGTWENGSVTPGFKQNETLHVDGYFRFGPETPTGDPGVIALANSNFTVDEGDGVARVNVSRTVGSAGRVTVDYETQPGSATAGSDFTAVSGTLVFEDGETEKTIEIPILDDSTPELIEQFNVTIDNVNGGATLLAPRTATVTINDDETPLPEYDDFASVSGLNLNGSARRLGSSLELTPETDNRAGSAFFETPISLDQDGSFRTQFSFEALGGSGGADGLTFTIQNDSQGSGALGSTGGSLGYDGINNSVAVEFDTYRNSGTDVNNNHVSIIQGSVANALRTSTVNLDLNSGNRIYAWVDYNGTSDSLAVYLSDSSSKPSLALMKTTIDLETVVGDSAYVGFTAGTGGLNNSHRIRNWTLDQQNPPQNPPTEQGDTVNAVDVITNLSQPTAVDWLPNGRMLIAEKGGVVKTAVNGNVDSVPFLDISGIVNGTRDRGLLDIAVHPDFDNNPYVYLLFTYDPPEVNNQAAGTLAGPDGKGNRAGRLIRVTADVNNGYRTAVAGSDVVLLGTNSTWDNFNGFVNSTVDFDEPPAGENPDGTYLRDFIPSDSESHTVGGLAFGIDGSLFVSTGDGASYNRVDVRADRVQDVDSLSGKVLRIDPITGQGLADNPYFNGDADANRSKVYQSGLRNPFRLSVDSSTGQLFVGDVGWTKWEEINSAGPGANFGWPFYEGGSGSSIVNDRYANTPEGQAFFAQNIPVEASIYGLNHQADGINAIVMGDAYRGSLYGAEYEGDIFFNDLGQGIVRHASINPDGSVADVKTFTTGANVVVAISQGPDGALYYVDLDDNKIGRWEIV